MTADAPQAVGAAEAGGGRTYDAFISYSHAADGRLAPALQTALQAIGKPWYRRRAVRIFRDTTSLSASPELWPTIERALERSHHFVLLASPDATASPWVDQEVAWWRAHRDSGTFLIALTGGELDWDDARRDFTTTSSVPPALRGWFASEPLWVDLGWARGEEHLSTRTPAFRDAAASLAGPIRGIDKDELVGEDIRQHRRAIRLARGAVALLTVLTIAAIAAGVFAQVQRGRAVKQAREATSLALASTSSPLVKKRPDVALLLAFEAYRSSPRTQARSAVVAALAEARDSGVAAILHGHTDDVSVVAFSPDGRIAASAAGGLGDDDTIRLWDVRTHRPLGTPLTGHRDSIFQLAFSRDGRTLVSTGLDYTIRRWDVGSGRELGRPITAVSGSDTVVGPDGRTVAVVEGGEIQLYDARTGKAVGPPIISPFGVSEETGALSPDGRTFAAFSSGSLEGRIELWDLRSRRRIGGSLRHPPDVDGVAFTPDGRTLASFGGKTIRVWNARTARPIGSPITADGRFTAIAFAPDGRTLAAGDERKLELWDSRTGQLLAEPLRGHSDFITSVAFGPNARTLVTGSDDDTVRLWDLRRRASVATPLFGHDDWVHSVAFSPDGRMLASAGRDAAVQLWNVRTKTPLGEPLVGHRGWIDGVAFSSDGRTLATGGEDDTVRLWDARTHRQLGAPIGGHGDEVGAVAFAPGGRTLASADADGKIRFWDVRTRKRVGRSLTGPVDSTTGDPEAAYALAFTPDGRTLASAGTSDAAVRLWDVATRRRLGAPLQTRTNGIGGIAVSSDGRTLALGTDDGTVQFWDIATHRRLGTPFAAHGDAAGVSSVAFSPDGRTLASASWDHTVRFWDVATHEPVGVPLETGTQLSSVAFSPDGQAVAAAGEDATVWLWTGLFWRDDRELAHLVCGLVGGGLSESEWARYAAGIPYRNSCG